MQGYNRLHPWLEVAVVCGQHVGCCILIVLHFAVCFPVQERPSGMYNLSAYYIARTFADIPAELINTLLFVVITYCKQQVLSA